MRNIRFFAAIVLINSLLGISSPALADHRTIVGSWLTVVSGLQPPAVEFNSLDTYFRDGTTIGANAPDGVGTTGHGSWKRLRRSEENDFAFTVLFVVVDPTAFPPDSEFVRVRGEMEVINRDEMTGPFVVEFLDADFNTLFSDSGTRHLTRVGVERLP